jgi:hypothetical protein
VTPTAAPLRRINLGNSLTSAQAVGEIDNKQAWSRTYATASPRSGSGCVWFRLAMIGPAMIAANLSRDSPEGQRVGPYGSSSSLYWGCEMRGGLDTAVLVGSRAQRVAKRHGTQTAQAQFRDARAVRRYWTVREVQPGEAVPAHDGDRANPDRPARQD